MKTTLKMNYPAQWWLGTWREALPSGNSRIGAAVYGQVHEETILVNHQDLWTNSIDQQLPDISDTLGQMRQMFADGQYDTAQSLMCDALKAQGYQHSTATPMPLGDIKTRMITGQRFHNYSRQLDMETGQVTVDWHTDTAAFQRALFVSIPDDVIVYECRADKKGTLNAEFWLDVHDPLDAAKPLEMKREPLPANVETSVTPDFFCYAATNTDGTDFGMTAKLHCVGGTVTCEHNRWQAHNADSVLVLVKVFVKGSRSKNHPQDQQTLSSLTPDYASLLARHTPQHRDLLHRASLDLSVPPDQRDQTNEQLLAQAYQGQTPAALAEKLWYYGRYLLISTSRPGSLPCNLVGLWCGDYGGFWAINMANENIQAIYWQALSGNLPELLTPVFDYYDGMMDMFRTNARNLFGCRGIYIPAVTTPGEGLLQCISPHILHWTGGAAWLAQHYYDYYRFTKDQTFLRQRALPFMREAALFYQDFFILDPDGHYLSVPSQSPENTPGNFLPPQKDDGIKAAINATMDFALAKELLTNLIAAAQITQEYQQDIPTWQAMLDRIPPYQINDDGAIREWMHPDFTDNYRHRHQSHLYPVFPGQEIDPHQHPDLTAAFTKAIDLRFQQMHHQSSWSLAHMAAIYARLQNGDKALQCLDAITQSCLLNNLFTLHNDWRRMGITMDMKMCPFQIDGNMAWTGVLNEMLALGRPGSLSLLPALPNRWPQGSVSHLLCQGAIDVSIQWDIPQGIINAQLISPFEQTLQILLPVPIISLQTTAAHDRHHDRQIYNLTLPADTTVTLTAHCDWQE